MRLYKVYTPHFSTFVVANSLNDAWSQMKEYLDKHDCDFDRYRICTQIEVLADSENGLKDELPKLFIK